MRKHLTKSERESRQAAEAALEQPGRVVLRAPAWLDAEARKIFKATIRRLRGYDLLEQVDIEQLALYADAVARYRAGVKTLDSDSGPKEIQAVQAWSRMALAFADKLGFSQTARARLARKKAEQEPLDPMDQLLGSVNDFVNQGSGDGQ